MAEWNLDARKWKKGGERVKMTQEDKGNSS